MSDEPQHEPEVAEPNMPKFIASLRLIPGFVWPLLLVIPLTAAYIWSGKDQTIQNMLVSAFSSFLTLLIPRSQSQPPPPASP